MDFFKKKTVPKKLEIPKKIEMATPKIEITEKQIVQCLVCPCNNKVYKTLGYFNRHKDLQVHKTWELPQKNKDLEVLSTRLTVENDHLKRLNVILTNKIIELENKISIK